MCPQDRKAQRYGTAELCTPFAVGACPYGDACKCAAGCGLGDDGWLGWRREAGCMRRACPRDDACKRAWLSGGCEGGRVAGWAGRGQAGARAAACTPVGSSLR